MQRDSRGQLDFVVSAEPLSPSCFPELLLNYLRPGCGSRAEVFALNICQPGCRGSAISPSDNLVTFTIKPTGNIPLGVCQWELGLDPTPHVNVCAPHNAAALTQPSACSGAWLRGLSSLPTAHGPSWTQTLGFVPFCSESVGAVSSAFPLLLSTACGQRQLGGRARRLWLCCGIGGVHRCHREPPETMPVLTQLSWLGLVFCTKNELK